MHPTGQLRLLQNSLKPRANGRNIVDQQVPKFWCVTCYVHLHTLFKIVVCCWALSAKSETCQTLSYVHTDAATPNMVGQQCCVRLHWALSNSF